MKKTIFGLMVAVTLPSLMPAPATAQYRDWRDYRRYDYNRLPPGQQYYYADKILSRRPLLSRAPAGAERPHLSRQ